MRKISFWVIILVILMAFQVQSPKAFAATFPYNNKLSINVEQIYTEYANSSDTTGSTCVKYILKNNSNYRAKVNEIDSHVAIDDKQGNETTKDVSDTNVSLILAPKASKKFIESLDNFTENFATLGDLNPEQWKNSSGTMDFDIIANSLRNSALRANPNVKSKMLINVPKHAILNILSLPKSNWIQVKYDNFTGWLPVNTIK